LLPSRSNVFYLYTMYRLFYLLLSISFSVGVYAQSDKFLYETDLLTKEFHAGRREALRALMPDSSVAIFFPNPLQTRSNDVEYQYSQAPDFYYLSGYPEPNSLLVIFKEKVLIDSVYTNEIIFVQDRDPKKERWTGRRLGTEGVRKVLGFETVFLNTQFYEHHLKLYRFKRY
jgi:Xaa-Pro aminopeptidase